MSHFCPIRGHIIIGRFVIKWKSKTNLTESVNRNLDANVEFETDRQTRGPSQLFLLRVWPQNTPGANDCQGRLQHTVTGESHYFHSCDELRLILFGLMSPRGIREMEEETDLEGD